MRPRWKKVFRDIVQNRSRTIFVVLSVAVGVFAVATILGARGILIREFEASLVDSNPAAVTVYTMGFDTLQAQEVEGLKGVGEVESRTTQVLRYSLDPVEKGAPDKENEWKQIQLDVLDDFDEQAVNKITSVVGKKGMPARGEVYIEQSAKQIIDVEVGTTLYVEQAGVGSTVRDVKTSEIVHDINVMPAQFSDTVTGYVSKQTAVDLGMPQVYTIMMVTSDLSNPTRADHEKLADEVTETLENNNVEVVGINTTNPGAHFLGDIFKAVALLLLFMGVLSMFLSGFLVVNTINALMSSQIKQIGIMKAVGGRSKQVSMMYVVMLVILSALALMIGIPAAAIIGQKLINYAIGIINFRVSSMIPPAYTLALTAIVGLLVPLVSSLGSIMRGARTPIVKAFNPAATEVEDGFGTGRLDKLLSKIRSLPRPISLSLRNTFLQKGRIITTLITLSLACALIMSVFTIRSGIDKTIDNYGVTWTYDIQMQFSDPESASEIAQIAEKEEDVEALETWLAASISYIRPNRTRDDSVSITSLDPATKYYHPEMDEGRWISEDSMADEVCISSEFIKNNPAAKLGSTITLETNNKKRDFKVVGVFPHFEGQTDVYVSETVWKEWTGVTNLANTLYLETPDLNEAQREDLAEKIESAYNDNGYTVRSYAVRTILQDVFADQMGILVMFLFIMAGILGAVGVIGLSGTMMINVVDSTREIGVMRAIGASHRSIFAIFITQGVVIALVSWAFGALFSWPLSYVLNQALGVAVGFSLTYTFSFFSIFVTLVMVVAIAVVASLLPSWRASQISVRDAISYE